MNSSRRVVLGVLGLGTLVIYLLAGVVGYRLLRALWTQRPPVMVVVATVLGTALLFGALSYWTGTARLKRSLDAVELPRSRAPALYRRYDRLTERMRAGEPSLLVARLPVPNAFAVGGPGGAIVVDRRLFALLSLDELETLLAHELAHFERRDALVQTLGYSLTQSIVGLVGVVLFPVVVLTGGIARAVALLRGDPGSWSQSLLGRTHRGALGAVALAGFAVTLLVLSYSRRREWAADDRAAALTGKPLALARALRKIERASTPDLGPLTPLYVHGTEESRLSRLLSTHPPMDDRVARLERLARRRG
ncbi:M48 family metallopeptidase [Haloarcula laminariae]|uniref:M48 family metallopeptidase n=1 Tax=Haloarcula laminariae TaxID=2961577 RepID=UPI0024057D80|nr:M48 family metalloprotease [Halomicroarcula sp. FL173]